MLILMSLNFLFALVYRKERCMLNEENMTEKIIYMHKEVNINLNLDK